MFAIIELQIVHHNLKITGLKVIADMRDNHQINWKEFMYFDKKNEIWWWVGWGLALIHNRNVICGNMEKGLLQRCEDASKNDMWCFACDSCVIWHGYSGL